jgi:hypothetical protein
MGHEFRGWNVPIVLPYVPFLLKILHTVPMLDSEHAVIAVHSMLACAGANPYQS